MNYQETTEYLFNSTPVFEHVGASAYKEGLFNTLTLDEHFHHPHKRFKSIHVAGTNGKGSCSHTLAAILQAEGYKVGLYTSPHLVDFRERIRVNGKPISEQYVIDFVEQERDFFEPLHPSFFELTTAMAFKFFAEQEVDIAVIEVGLGGRLDCTNIITPLLSIITNISFDHTQFLGNTLAKIAGEKAGIIKQCVPVVIGEAVEQTRPVFLEKARSFNAPIVFAEDEPEIVKAEPTESRLILHTRHFGTITNALSGTYQIKNANTILSAGQILKEKKIIQKDESILQGFLHVSELTGLQGRWQTLQNSPLVICDTGHNLGGWQYLSTQINQQRCHVKRLVFGMVDDKDLDSVLSLLPRDAVFYWTQASSHRAIPAEEVKKKGDFTGLKGHKYSSVAEAYEAALADADADDFIFVGGSSYVVADLLSWIAKKPKVD